MNHEKKRIHHCLPGYIVARKRVTWKYFIASTYEIDADFFSDHFRIVFLLEENMDLFTSFFSCAGMRVEVSCFSSEEIVEWDLGVVLGYGCECKQAGADCNGLSQASENEWKIEENQNGNRRRNKEISSAIWRELELGNTDLTISRL